MSDKLPLEGRQVLVVEDQYLLARDVCEWLEAAGAQVVGPDTRQQESVRAAGRAGFDSAVVDINLGRGPTYEVAARLNERDVPFLFATGYDEAAIPSEFQGAPRLEKPFRGTQLVDALQALGGRRD